MALGPGPKPTPLPQDAEERLQQCVWSIRNLFPVDLKSIVLFGSAVRGHFRPKRSQLHLLVVLEDVQFEHLARLTPYVESWLKQRISAPLVLDLPYLKNSLDTYPIETLEMSILRRILVGDDPFHGLNPSNEAVRRQCERELKAVLLRMQRVLLESGMDAKALHRMLDAVIAPVVRLARYVLWLCYQELHIEGVQILRELEAAAKVRLATSRYLWSHHLGTDEFNKRDAPQVFKAFMLEVQSLARFTDSMGHSHTSHTAR